MKRLIIASVILVLIVIICITGNVLIRKSVKKTEREITSCETLYKNGKIDEAHDASLRFKKRWSKTVAYVSVYSNHCPLDKISNLAAILPEAVESQNDFEVGSTISQIKSALEFILSEQGFKLQNMY